MASKHIIEFEVEGIPQVQGNHRVSRSGYTYDTNKKLAPWRRRVALVARQAMNRHRLDPIEGPVSLTIEYALPRTKAMKTDPPPPMVQRPDSTKLTRAIEDALSGIVYADDSQITDHRTHKRRAFLGEQPHARVRIEPATQEGGEHG